jgi:serine/threonine-protein kinase
MELLDGIDMETLVARHGPIEPERVVHLMSQACHSLHEAHQRQLIHRDVKPANLFVCRNGEDLDFVKVLDFGLVKHGGLDRERHPKLTADGSITGTPAYLYPEAITGEGAIDHRADLYALGCVAYWLLTGQLVFSADSHTAMLVEHATAVPVAPSRRAEFEIPPELDALILACLEKKPSDRPGSAKALAGRLREIPGLRPWDQDRAAA